MVAVVLLAICAVPMADAIRNGIAASAIGVDKARELRCMKNTMETVLAEPYPTLWTAARGKDTPAAYTLPADASCTDIARQVTIALYEHAAGRSPVFLAPGAAANQRESALLHVTVASDKGYSFTTLVAR